MGWTLVVAVVILAALLGGWAISKGRQPRPEIIDEVDDELVADAEAVRAAAERAVVAADEARFRAESAEKESTEAEDRYLAAQWEVRSEPDNHLVQRAALDAYRRGELTVTQLNAIWEHAGSSGLDPRNVEAARDEYDRALAATAQVRHEAGRTLYARGSAPSTIGSWPSIGARSAEIEEPSTVLPRSMFALTASALKGAPSWKVTPWRRVIRRASPSSSQAHSVASPGIGSPSGDRWTRRS